MPRFHATHAAWSAPPGLLCALWLLLPAAQAVAGPPEVTATPAALVLGDGRQVEVRVRAGGEPSSLQAACNVGRFTARNRSGDETVFLWTPPDVRYPHTALLLFWVDPPEGNAPDVAAVRIPLLGRLDLEVKTEPRADVMVEIGQKTFGPKKATARGQVKVPIEVPPGVTSARVISYVGGTSSAVEAPLEVPPTNPLLAIAGPDPMPRDRGWLWVFHTGTLSGSLSVNVTGGSALLLGTQDDRALYELAASRDALRLEVVAKLPDHPDAAGQVTLKVVDRTSPAPASPRRRTVGWGLGSSALAGGFFGGGSNLGVLASVDVSVSPPLLDGRGAFGGQIEVRSMGLTSSIPGLGSLESWVIGLSLDAVARLAVLEVGPLSVHLRAGAGILFYSHQVETAFQPSFSEGGATTDLFGAAQLAYRVGPVDALVEVRGSLAVVQTPRLDARMGGLLLAVGARVY